MWPFRRKDPAVKAITHQRQFAAAQVTNLLSKWGKTSEQIDADLQKGGRSLRARARDVAKNNDYAKKYLDILKTNVIGKDGIRLQVQAKTARGKLDHDANERVEAAWREFSRHGACDVTGKMSLVTAQRLFISSCARDGEVLIREYHNYPNASGYAIQFLNPDLLDEQHNAELNDGRTIRMGIEYNASGFPVAYHLTPIRNDVTAGNPRAKTERVPAQDIIHAYMPDYSWQSRGYTWMHAAMVEMHHLAAFNEAAIVAARIGASTMGFFTETLGGEFGAAADDKQGNDFTIDAEPGSFRRLPAGLDFKMFDSKYPSDMVDDFIKRSLKSIASGLNIGYNTLASDPEGTSYGTLRNFSIEERDNYRMIQNWVAEVFLDRIYRAWLRNALRTRLVNFPEDRYSKLIDVRWQPRGWQWIDPAKDAVAFEKMIANNLTSRSQIAAEQGRDFEEVCRQIADDNDTMKKYGLMPAIEKDI